MRKYEDVLKNYRVFCIDELCENGSTMGGSVRLSNGKILNFIAGWNEDGKEHVSVSLADGRKFHRGELPTWDDMCLVKDIFWDEEEEVFQIHPPRSCYYDLGAVLHLWRAQDGGEIHAEGVKR